MTQLSGGVSIDEGHRAATPNSSRSAERSRPEARARRSSPGAWSEDLGRWGSQPWNLPGQGDRGARCGEYYPESVCDECGEPSFGSHTCGRRSCPECWGVWAKESGVRATRRVQEFRYTQPPGAARQAAHAVVSPDEGDVMTEREFWKGRKRAAQLLEEKGWRGFAIIPHPFRVTDEGKDRYQQADPDYGIWVWLRSDVEEWRDLVYWSPHYHAIGVTGREMDPARESDEMNYVFIRSFESFEGVRDTESHRDVYGAFRYLLSHTGYPEGSAKQVTTWYGSLANSVFVEEATEEWQHEKPSAGVRSALEREIESVAGVDVDDDSDDVSDESDDVRECPIDECGGEMIDVFDVRAYLRQVDPPPEVRKAMECALEWRLGERAPPPGLKRPGSESEAREAFGVLVE